MSKLLIRIVGLIVACFTTVVFAQSTFNGPTNSSTSSSSSTPKTTPLPVLSPNDFKNRVNTMNQQTQNDLNQQVLKRLSAPTSKSNSQPQSPSNSGGTDQQNMAPSDNSTPDNTPSGASNSQTSPKAELPPPPAPNDTGDSSMQAPSNSQPYTGFGAGSAGKSNGSPGAQSGGGWNVKY